MGTRTFLREISYKLIVPSSEQVTLRNTCSGGGRRGRDASYETRGSSIYLKPDKKLLVDLVVQTFALNAEWQP